MSYGDVVTKIGKKGEFETLEGRKNEKILIYIESGNKMYKKQQLLLYHASRHELDCVLLPLLPKRGK